MKKMKGESGRGAEQGKQSVIGKRASSGAVHGFLGQSTMGKRGSCSHVNGIPTMEEEERGQRPPGICSCASMVPSGYSCVNGIPMMEEEEKGQRPSGIWSCASMAPGSCSCGHGICTMKEEEGSEVPWQRVHGSITIEEEEEEAGNASAQLAVTRHHD